MEVNKSLKALWIRVNTTFDCNMKKITGAYCPACYVKKDRHGPEGNMTEEVMNRLVEIYRKHTQKYGKSNRGNLLFYGGEPTLYPERMIYLGKKFREISPMLGLGFFTNGLELNKPKMLEWCRENNVVVHLSLNELDLEFFDKQMAMLRREKCKVFPFILGTRRNLNRLKEALTIIRRYTSRVQIRELYACTDPEYVKLFSDKTYEAMKWILKSGRVFNPELMFMQMSVFPHPSGMWRHMCGVRFFTVDPDGSVVWCPGSNDSIGNIFDEGFEFIKNMQNHEAPIYSPVGVEECQNCPYVLMCGGGCPILRYKAHGTYDAPSAYCPVVKRVMPLVLDIKRRYLLTHKDLYTKRGWYAKNAPKNR